LNINAYVKSCDGSTPKSGVKVEFIKGVSEVQQTITTDAAGKAQIRCGSGWCQRGDGSFTVRVPNGYAPTNTIIGGGCRLISGSSTTQGKYYECDTDTWNTSTGSVKGGFEFKQVSGCATNPPKGYLGGSRSGMTVGTSRTFYSTVTDVDGDLTGAGMYYRVKPLGTTSFGSWAQPALYYDVFTNRYTYQKNAVFSCNSTNKGTIQLVVNGYDAANHKCTGNPDLKAGWSDCKGSPTYPDLLQFECR
jgi:hypothetical protein